MVKPKLTQSQRRKAQKARAAAAALTGPPAPTTGPRDGAVHRVVLPAARGRQSGLRRQVEMVVFHYHFYQQIVAGGNIPPGGQDMSVPPPTTVLSEPTVVQSHPRVVQSHPEVLALAKGHGSIKGLKNKTLARVRSGKPVLTLWGSSHLAKNHLLGPDLDVSLRAHFQKVINLSKSGEKLTIEITEQMEIAMRSHPGPNQVYVILMGGNNMRKTTKPVLEVAKIVSRYRRIMAEAQKAKVRVLLCGTIPDPRPAVDSKLKLLDEALKDLEMGEGNKFLTLRGSMLDAQGHVRKDIFKPNGDIHLNAAGTKIASLRIQRMLETMLPNLVQGQVPAPSSVPVQAPAPAQVQTLPAPAKPQRTRVQAPVSAPVVVNEPPVVDATLVAAVINAPVIVQHVSVQNVVPEVSTAMEVEEDEEALLQRLFFKQFGRALPIEKEKDEVDQIKFVIDLTEESDKMEVAAPVPVAVVKTEPAEAPEIVANVASVSNVDLDNRRCSFRLERLELAKARRHLTEFGKSLRKTNVIPEKEAPENVIADNDTDMAEDVSVNAVESVNTVETAEKALAETDAAIAANREEFAAEFGDVPLDEFDDVVLEPLC
jgi:hypothetical protein